MYIYYIYIFFDLPKIQHDAGANNAANMVMPAEMATAIHPASCSAPKHYSCDSFRNILSVKFQQFLHIGFDEDQRPLKHFCWSIFNSPALWAFTLFMAYNIQDV